MEIIIPTDFLRRIAANSLESNTLTTLKITQDEQGTTAETIDGYVLHRFHDGRTELTYPRTDFVTESFAYPTEFILQADALAKCLRKPDEGKGELVSLEIADGKLRVQRGETVSVLEGIMHGPSLIIRFSVKQLRAVLSAYQKREVKLRFIDPKKQARIEGGMDEFSIIMPCLK